jgi:hypothetical protein
MIYKESTLFKTLQVISFFFLQGMSLVDASRLLCSFLMAMVSENPEDA